MRTAAILGGLAAAFVAAASASAQPAAHSAGEPGLRGAASGADWSTTEPAGSGFATRDRPIPSTDSVAPDYMTFSRPRTRTDKAWNYAWYGSVG